MKTILLLAFLASLLASCGGGGGNPGTCEPTTSSVCEKADNTVRENAAGSAVQADSVPAPRSAAASAN